ncbi:ATP synthase subunit I [Alkaliphilus sp. MSJ-5]|uniref:ATP synthase subunit I n=1 Tax=Alkaliphilus flagellatus TaxID=2841507 RepID=A0ABS6G4I0_9FIRM|nr:ATP synthase subunit I [Alkaliphilus flagellatus]MBU5676592.1 ATP synthase subunit I [Alkaliphilus flagellatus]
MGHTWDIQVKIAKGVLILNLLIGAASLIVIRPFIPFIKGLAFGSLIAILNFRLLALTIDKAIKMPPHKAQTYSGSRYIVRFFINAVVIYISLKGEHINALGTIIGLISIKPIILKEGLFNEVKFFKKIFIK